MKKLLTLICACVVFMSSAQNQYNIVPLPQTVTPQKGQFVVKGNTSIVVSTNDPAFKQVASMLADQLGATMGTTPKVVSSNSKAVSNSIQFVKNDQLAEEGYTLNVSSKQVSIAASTGKGAFYALQSLLQLLPNQIFSKEKSTGITWSVPNCSIADAPRYSYRGLHLDVGRHFFPVSFIKKYIDLIALHKLNNFHWHLTEDQGWRIEIKRYPKLAEIASKRAQTVVGRAYSKKFDGKPYGGYYTQDEVKEVVAYAKAKFVNVIPEIEMPGHSQAVLAAYPEFGCNPDKIYQTATDWGVYEDVLCPREETFQFLENVLTEVMELFPSEYIHIGGDECPKKQWKESRFCQEIIKRENLGDEHGLQSYFIRRIDKFITSKGRKMIGWDEILEGGLSPNAIVMSWRGTEGGIAAAKENHDAIMTPGGYVYLDHYQADPKTEPLAIGGFTTLEKIYSYEPTPTELSPEQQKHIIGVQANVWTEYMQTSDYVEYMVFPRASALSEVAWTKKELKDYSKFSERMKVHADRLEKLHVNFFKGFLK
ncbi:beta-N-acetylhexosaminidase [Flectobacillus sp. BAB-3569]|uniref:beta-N-acetylhexosaminidase n=1 Tax=Flectobacillus sp. BAB-3569 TaxID=1509483 RepID=UPI000BA2BCFB|nr:beta-N-acetylhexosaminidase [Flectobacillus sp. BAB-3569]PAC33234.1 beta-N-acetylglucosaminidase [Flectobacillus sp. BAB-3569]